MKVQHIAIEGKCFFINTDMIIRRSSYPSDLQEYNIVSKLPGLVCRRGSCIIDSYGHYLTKPVWDKETIIYAELDMNLPAACKMEHDAIGHYACPNGIGYFGCCYRCFVWRKVWCMHAYYSYHFRPNYPIC